MCQGEETVAVAPQAAPQPAAAGLAVPVAVMEVAAPALPVAVAEVAQVPYGPVRRRAEWPRP
jgi:hypothetical protein